mgnify:CR=1 FL=1
MKIQNKTKIYQIVIWLCLVVFFTVAFLGELQPALASAPSSLVEIKESWEYQWGQASLEEERPWQKWDLQQGHLEKETGYNYLWLRTRLPQGAWDNPVIYLYGVLANSLEVYLDGNSIYCSQEVDSILGNQGMRRIIVPLPDSWAGKTLFLRLEVGSNQYVGLYGNILLGLHKSILQKIIRYELDYLILGFFFLIFTLVIFVISLFVKEIRYKKALFALLCFALCTGVWNITEYDNIDLIIFQSPLWVYLDAISVLLSPVAGFYFYEQVFGSGPKQIIRRLWQLHLLYALPYLVLITIDAQIANPYTYHILESIYSWELFRVLFFLDSLIILGTVLTNRFTSNPLEARIFACGIAFLSFSLIYKDLSLVNWGIFFCIFSFILILSYRFVNVHQCLEQMVTTKTEELRDLLVDLEEQNKAFAHQLTIDPLTKIYNKLKFNQCLEEEIAKSREGKSSLSVIMFDIDHFKEVNDKFGHLTGDYVLVNLAKLIGQNLGNKYIFARWGGEEFIILTPGDDLEAAGQLAERLRFMLECHPFAEVGKVTCSFGVSELLENDTPNCLIKRVDDALYLAKNNSRNQVKTL